MIIVAGPDDNALSVALAYANAHHSFHLSIANGINPTDELLPGQQLQKAQIVKENFKSFEELLKTNQPEPTQQYKTLPYQTLYDVAAQENGSVLALIDWALFNGINPTDELLPGHNLFKPLTSYTHTKRANYFKGKAIKLVTQRKQPSSTPAVNYLDYLLPGIIPYNL